MGVSELTDKLGLHSLRSRTVRTHTGPSRTTRRRRDTPVGTLLRLTCCLALSPQWYVQATCATQGTGLYEGLDWLSNELAK